MLTTVHQPRFSYLRRLIILPLLVIVFALFAFKFKEDNKQPRLASFNKLSKHVTASENNEPAQFPGGLQEWRRYLERNADLAALAEHKAPEGKYTVIAEFTVSKDGSISIIVTETKAGYGTEEEVIRAISKAPKWQPAKKDGAFAESQVKQTLTFTVVKEQWAYVEINSITVANVKTTYVTY